MIGVTKTSVVLTNAELTSLVLDNASDGVVKVNVPRKEGNDGPNVTVKIDAAAFKAALAIGLEVDADDLDDMELTCKKDGGLEISYNV